MNSNNFGQSGEGKDLLVIDQHQGFLNFLAPFKETKKAMAPSDKTSQKTTLKYTSDFFFVLFTISSEYLV